LGFFFTLPSGCFTPNCNSQTNTTHSKADYTIVGTVFHYVWIFFKISIFYRKRVRGCRFYEREKREAKMLLDILSDFVCGPLKEEQIATL
jgi:hypothetical protein